MGKVKLDEPDTCFPIALRRPSVSSLLDDGLYRQLQLRYRPRRDEHDVFYKIALLYASLEGAASSLHNIAPLLRCFMK